MRGAARSDLVIRSPGDSVKENLGVANVGVPEVGCTVIDPEEEADRSSVPTDWRPPGTPGVGCPIDSEGARPSSHVHYRPTDQKI